MNTPNQSVSVEGNQNQVFTVARDMIITEAPAQQGFFEPNLEQFSPPAFIPPKNVEPLIAGVAKQRLVVLAGDPGIDKAGLARYMAWYLKAASAPNRTWTVLEWYRTADDAPSLALAVQQTEDPTIFILPQLMPQDASYDLLALQAAAAGKHLIIASTQSAFAHWQAEENVRTLFWRELTPEALYSADDLAEILIQKLATFADALPSGLLPEALVPHSLLAGRWRVSDVARRLRTPDNIAVFVQLLCAEAPPVTETTVEALFAVVQDNRRTLQRWFALLSPREQLMALGLSLFDGLFDDQCFAALDSIMTEVWQRRDPLLQSLDYGDLDKLHTLFHFVETEDQELKIEGRFPEQRRLLFEIAWHTHRRRILAALPVLTRLVRESVGARSTRLELYGTYARRSQLRAVVGETLSDLGLIAPRAIQEALLSLAADDDWAVQAVAASTLARWRAYEHDEAFVAVLDDWAHSPGITNALRNMLVERGKEAGETHTVARTAIRNTTALALGYATRYDPPNQLTPQLRDLIWALVRDPDEAIRERVEHFLRMALPLHLKQSAPLLHAMLHFEMWIPSVARGLAYTYRTQPTQVLKLMGEWYEEARNIPYQPQAQNEQRNALLAAIALTYGYIKLGEGERVFTVKEVLARLYALLEHEQAPSVRIAVLQAIGQQAKSHFDSAVPLLYKVVTLLNGDERPVIVGILKDIFLEQRAQVPGGDWQLRVHGRYYPVWVDKGRPKLTAVELAMLRWVKSHENPHAQQVAFEASVAFAHAFELEEARFIQEKRHESQQQTVVVPRKGQPGLHPLNGLTGAVTLWLVTLNAMRYRPMLTHLLPEALVQNKRHMNATQYVLSKWALLRGDDDLHAVTLRLQSGIRWSRYVPVVLFVVAFILLSLCCPIF